MNIVTLFTNILVGGGAVVLAVQLLKSRFIPLPFQKYPRSTTAVASLLASVLTVAQAQVSLNIHDVGQVVSVFVGTLWVAVSVYNHLIKTDTADSVTPANK